MINPIFDDLYQRAHLAGRQAGQACKPQVMIVDLGNGRTEEVADGPCGFAWVTIHPGNSSFARWAKDNGYGDKAYGGGIMIWVSEFNQSMERKQAYSRAFAKVLQDAGITAYTGSRID